MADFRIKNEVGATVFAVLAGLSALFLTAWIFGAGGCTESGQKVATVPTGSIETELSSRLLDAEASLDEEAARRAALALELDSAKKKADKLSAENAKLKGIPTTGDAAKLDEQRSRLVDLRAKLKTEADAKAKIAAQAEAQQKKLLSLKTELETLRGEKVDSESKLAEITGEGGRIALLTAEIAAVKKIVDQKNNALDASKQQLANVQEAAEKNEVALEATIDDLKKGDSERIAKLTADLETAKKDSAESMKPLEARVAELEAELKASTEKAAKASTELEATKKAASEQEKALAAEFAALKGSMTGSSDDSKKLAAEIEALKKSSAEKAKTMQAEIEKLKKSLEAANQTCAADKKKLQAEIDRLKAELKKAKNAKPVAMVAPAAAKPADGLDLPMLVNDPSKLQGKLLPLFERLQGIKETTADRDKVYAEIAADGHATAVHRIPFESGSAAVSPEQIKELTDKLKGVDPGATFLVVGYASIDGSNEANRTLSSRRASQVAQEVSKIAKAGSEKIQAVYFGQTKRFNEKYLTPNRVVEVWSFQ